MVFRTSLVRLQVNDSVRNKEKMEKNKEEAFFSVGFHSWNKATNAFRLHQKSKCHLAALSFEVTIPSCGNVIEMSNESMKAGMKENRKCLIKILETLQFLGRKGLALRGDENDENSNFIQLLKLRSKAFVKLNQWLEEKIIKELKILSNTMDTSAEITILIKYSQRESKCMNK